MKDDLKLIITILIFFCFIAFLCSCAKNEKVYKGIVQGIYEGTKQIQEMKNDDPTPEPDNEIPSYDQYERERQEMIKDKNK